jgi:hypothetical protein
VVDWRTDENGFRNPGATRSADIVVLGDSYIEYGPTAAETFAARLQEKLPDLTIVNLGKSGYGPVQYVEVLNRFGLSYKPRYAVFAFYEGNDILDIRNYRLWKAGQLTGGEPTYFIGQENIFRRYWRAVHTTVWQVAERGLMLLQGAMEMSPFSNEEPGKLHPEVALVDLGAGKVEKVLISDSFSRLEAAVGEPENWAILEAAIGDFKELCASHGIIPIFLYIPSPSHLYARFTTDQSGVSWLAIRDLEIAAQGHVEEKVSRLVESAGIDFVNLTRVFEHEARKGELLYLRVDPHWNSTGTQLAASFLADHFKRNYVPGERHR